MIVPTIVTSSKGRLSHLKQSLPTWLEHTPCKIVVVDYSCPEDTGGWVRSLKREQGVELGRVHVYEAITGKPTFNKAHALNLGALFADDFLLFLDADTCVTPELGPWLRENLHPTSLGFVQASADLTGVLAVSVERFRAVGGYDEGMQGWGSEDLDLRLRLYLSPGYSSLECMPAELFRPIPHGDDLRTRFYSEKDKQSSQQRNFQRLVDNIERSTRVSIFDLQHDSNVRALLGATPSPGP